MTTPTPNIIEETWWEVTTSTGLILRLPAPLQHINVTREPTHRPYTTSEMDDALAHGLTVSSSSAITKKSYAVSLRNAVLIQTSTVRMDPARYDQAVAKAVSKRLSGTSSDAGQEAVSPSASPTSPSGPSTGGPTRKRTLH